MKLKLGEAARALDMPERELLRLVREGTLPALRVHDQYLFNSVELQEWAARKDRKIALEVIAPRSQQPPGLGLADAIARGGVHHDVAGATRNEVLEAVSRLPGVPEHVDRTLLAEVLRMREGLASTGIGGGVAIPHPRNPLVFQLENPVVLLCFLAQPVDFAAIDDRPIRALFTLLSPTISLHLHMLSRLAAALHDASLNQFLAAQASEQPILARIRELEAHLAGPEPEGKG